jgi:outer membrane protein insertion porin family
VIIWETIGVVGDAAPTTETRPLAIELVGNRAFSTAEIRADVAHLESPLLDGSGAVDDESLQREVLLISSFYWDHGYANVKIGTPRFERSRNTIVIPVDEGPSFTIDTVTVKGQLIGDEHRHLAMIHIRPGERFSRKMIADDRETLATFYEDQAYAYADVRVTTQLDLARRTIGLAFEIDHGVPASFERVDLINNSRTSDDTIRRAIAVAAGQPYNATRLDETRRRVAALGRFHDVAVSIRHGSTDALVVATIEVSDE